ncbi:MAG TPA: hypothetical protein HPQ04_03260 [Rhodospirillaceae bacterium]|nr:hypothetical protein [Rhodospirillaceae bacterium]
MAYADDIANQLDAAHITYGKGDLLRTLTNLQGLVSSLNARLVDQFAKALPPPPSGWEGNATDSQTLDGVGGGLSVARSYSKGEGMLNASLIVDNPAVAAAQSLFQSNSQVTAQPGWSRLKLGADDALLRFDGGTRSGEIMMVIGARVLLEIEGTEIGREDILVEAAKGWNLSVVRRLIAAGS